jgi:hypothetical protein
MLVTLPTTRTAAVSQSPKKLLIYSSPKVGKTSLVSKLPNCLIIDMEDSSSFYDCMSVNICKIASENNITKLNALKEVIKSLHAQKVANKNIPIYDYICLDTTSALEDLAITLANIRYKESPIGKSFTGDVMNLPQGAGYALLREAFDILYNYFNDFYGKGLILLGHTKSSSINKNGMDLNCKDLAMTGKLKQIITSQMDCIGNLYRNKSTNENIISFKSSEQDLLSGSRCKHLQQQEFVISKLEGDELITYWDKIFLELQRA